MRMKAVLLVGAVMAMASPAFAQGSYYQNCEQSRNSNQIGGMILGSILGGVAGSNIAASGHRHDGTAVGAVLGGVIGSGVGRGSVNCGPPPGYARGYNDQRGYGGQSYGGQGGYGGSYYGQPPANMYPVDPGYSSYGYNSDYQDDRYLYDRDNRSYNRNDDWDRGCTTAMQTTRLRDGTTIRRPVEVCRDGYSGDWQVRD